MERVRIQVFNQAIKNGNIYSADSKEDVEKIFSKFIDNSSKLVLTNISQDNSYFVNNSVDHQDYFNKIITVDLHTVSGFFKDFEIVETGEIGIASKPIFEVWANLDINNTGNGDYVKSLFAEDVMTFGMRAIVLRSGGPNPTFAIKQVICFDLISKQ